MIEPTVSGGWKPSTPAGDMCLACISTPDGPGARYARYRPGHRRAAYILHTLELRPIPARPAPVHMDTQCEPDLRLCVTTTVEKPSIWTGARVERSEWFGMATGMHF